MTSELQVIHYSLNLHMKIYYNYKMKLLKGWKRGNMPRFWAGGAMSLERKGCLCSVQESHPFSGISWCLISPEIAWSTIFHSYFLLKNSSIQVFFISLHPDLHQLLSNPHSGTPQRSR